MMENGGGGKNLWGMKGGDMDGYGMLVERGRGGKERGRRR